MGNKVEISKRMRSVQPTPTYEPVSVAIRSDLHQVLEYGAKYHCVDISTYASWLVELALKDEIKLYGWAKPQPKYENTIHHVPTAHEKSVARKLIRLADKRMAEIVREKTKG